MATRRVRFEFYCDGAPDSLKFTHEVPEDLVTTRAQAQQDVEYQRRFGSALVPIMKEHEATCRAASSPFCGICGSPVATVLQTPMSFLNRAEDPFVGVLVSGLCGKGECEFQTRRDVQEEMSDVGAKSQTQLEPGGYFEAQDCAVPLSCDDGTLSKDSDISRWLDLVFEGMERLGRPPLAAQKWKQWMEEVGFEDVTQTMYRWPTNCWPRDPHYKELGTWSLANMDAALEAVTLAPLTRGLGWTKKEALVLVAKARKDLRDPKIHAYWPM
ncbi:hypothetical protein RB599_010320 [Gaeumannomyces hyphopodioides]